MRFFGYVVAQFTLTLAFVAYELGVEQTPDTAFGGMWAYLAACIFVLAVLKPWQR